MSKQSSGCRSCLIWTACLFLGFAIVVGVAAYFGYREARKFIDAFAQKQPLVLPAVQYSKPEMDALHQRIDTFLSAAGSGRTNARLALSVSDINALVANSWFSNRVYVSLESNVVAGLFSIPFEEMGMPLFSGRYFNGAGTLDVNCKAGVPFIAIQDASVNGIALPKHYMDWIRKQNFARNLTTNATLKASLERVGRISVVNRQLVIQVQADAPIERP